MGTTHIIIDLVMVIIQHIDGYNTHNYRSSDGYHSTHRWVQHA